MIARLAVVFVAFGCAFAAQPEFNELWMLWGHGVNARTPFSPAKSMGWNVNIPTSMTCQFATWSIPFDSLVSYGPFAINPMDGRIYIGAVCGSTSVPYLWILNNNGTTNQFFSLHAACQHVFPYASMSFEGYFNFLPDGSLAFGLCGMLGIYTAGTEVTYQQTTVPAVVLGVANTDPPQFLWAGGVEDSWWTQWGMYAVNFTTTSSLNVNKAAAVIDSTIMWGVSGNKLYNGHFNSYTPKSAYGLQTYNAPLNAKNEPRVVIAECGETRPWTFANDAAGNQYSAMCSGTVLAKYSKTGNQVWNLTAFKSDSNTPVTLFLTDDEQYIYVGDTRAMMYVVAAATGKIYQSFNLSHIAKAADGTCDVVYGPFAARWPVPLKGSHKVMTLCTSATTGSSLILVDPANLKTAKPTNIKGFDVASIFVDAANNVYAIGTMGDTISVHQIGMSSFE